MTGSAADYSLNIVDAPGFGDQIGWLIDTDVENRIREYFITQGEQGVTCLDSISLVTRSPGTRLSSSEKRLLDFLVSLVREDIEGNIFILTTSVDGNTIPVQILKARTQFKTFKFTNFASLSQLWNKEEASFGKLF